MGQLRLQCALATDLGRRANNEDSAFASGRIAVVADGVGGAAAGEVASRLAVDRIVSLDKRWVGGSLEEELGATVAEANQAIGFVVEARPETTGMSTTITVAALSDDDRYLVSNIGDSRTYLYRDASLRQLTRDDSLIQALIDYGELTPEEARDHPQRSIVTAVLDGRAGFSPRVDGFPAQKGDRLLLCSDGLSDAIDDGAIATIVATEDRDACAHALIAAALDAGGSDNITVVVADVVTAESAGLGPVDDRPGADGWSAT